MRKQIRLTPEEMAGVRRILAEPEPPNAKLREVWGKVQPIPREGDEMNPNVLERSTAYGPPQSGYPLKPLVSPTLARDFTPWVTETRLITPAEAQRILRECPYEYQRPVTKIGVERLAGELLAGRWEPSTISIYGCRETGKRYLINGQHRLHAIITSGRSAWLDVTSVDRDTYEEIGAAYRRFDVQKLRSLSQRIRTAMLEERFGFTSEQLNSVAAAVFHLAGGFTPGSTNYRANAGSQDDERIGLILKWGEYAKPYFELLLNIPRPTQRRMQTGCVVAFALITFRYQPDLAATFWQRTAEGAGLTMHEGAWSMREKVLMEPQSTNGAPLFARRMAKCWQAHYEGAFPSRIHPQDLMVPIEIAGTPYTRNAVVLERALDLTP